MTAMTADSILALARSFMESRILLTAVELDWFTLLSHEALTAEQVTRQMAGDHRAVTILLDALTAMDLLRKKEGKYECPAEIAQHLAADAPESVRPMVMHSANMWRRWSELTGIARGDPQARAQIQAPRSEADTRAFIGAMHVVGRNLAPRMVAAIDPGPARRLLDVGGASGTYTLAFLAASPQLRATIFDLPVVIEMARARCTQAGVMDRVTLVAGDFERDELPAGHDLALLSAIIHQNSPAQNVALYRKIWHALLPGGRLVIRDHIVSPDRTAPRAAALFAVNMLAGTEGGNVYTLDECRAALSAAGFERIRLIQPGDGGMNGLIEAFRPAP